MYTHTYTINSICLIHSVYNSILKEVYYQDDDDDDDDAVDDHYQNQHQQHRIAIAMLYMGGLRYNEKRECECEHKGPNNHQ
jgi:hypothetical protein